MNDNTDKKRSAASLSAANHWANKRTKPEHTNVIYVSSDDDDDQTSLKAPEPSTKSSQIHLIHNPSYDNSQEEQVNKDTVLIANLIGTKDLKESYQFNFNVDLEFILQYFHPDMARLKKPITFITGSRLLEDDDPDTRFIKETYNIKEIVAYLPNQFASHHTKMMINFFEDDTCEIVIMTCNLTKLDFGGLTQMLWRTGRLAKRSQSKPGTSFKVDLQSYLRKYNKKELRTLAQTLDAYDFSSVGVELIASAPSSNDMIENKELYGYGKLSQVLKRNNLLVDSPQKDKTYNVLSQVTSIAYPFTTKKGQPSSVFTHLLCPLIFSKSGHFSILEPGSASCKDHQKLHKYAPHIVFPTVKEVSGSNVGFAAGQAIHFNYTKSLVHKNQYERNIKPYLRKWNSSGSNIVTGREKVPPHVKMMMCDNGDNWSTLRWVLVGSHNLSKQAWGNVKGQTLNPTKYDVSSYELGVLIYPKVGEVLVPVYGKDTLDSGKQPVRLPFKLPPAPYASDDLPWSPTISYGNLKDNFGNTYNLE